LVNAVGQALLHWLPEGHNVMGEIQGQTLFLGYFPEEPRPNLSVWPGRREVI